MTTATKISVIGTNVVNTLVPFPLRNLPAPFPEQTRWGEIRDYAFTAEHRSFDSPELRASIDRFQAKRKD